MTKFHNFFQNFFIKILILGVNLLGFRAFAQIQTDLSNSGSSFIQNFNSATTTAVTSVGFSQQNVNNDTSTWRIFTTVGTTNPINIARGGTGACAGYPYNANAAADDWMFSSALTLKAGQQYRITFYYATLNAQGGPYPEKLKLYVGRIAGSTPTANDMTSVTTGQLIKDYGEFSNTDYVLSTETFTVTQDGTYYMGWYAYSDPDQYILRIDDITIQNITPVPNDISVSLVTTTASVSDCGSFTANTPFSIKVKNTGTSAQNNIPVNFTATRNGTSIGSINPQTINTLAAGDSTTLTVNIDATLGGTYVFTAVSALPNDQNPMNDTGRVTIFNPFSDLSTQGASYTHSFNSVIGAGWNTNPAPSNNLGGWFLVNRGTTAAPNGAVLAARNPTAALNDWLFTNCFKLQNGQKYRISYLRFVFNGSSNPVVTVTPEKLKLFVGNSATIAAMTTQLIRTGANGPGDETFSNTTPETVFYEYTHTAPTGVYYFGFQSTSDALPANFPFATTDAGIVLDDFSISALASNDMALKRVVTPIVSNPCGGFTANTPIQVKVWNSGTNPVSSFTARYRVRDAQNAVKGANMITTSYIVPPTGITTPTTPVAVGDTVTLNFNLDLSVPRFYWVDVYLTGDGQVNNDTLRFGVTNPYRDLTANSSSYSENFDSQLDLGWTALNQSTATTTWGYGANQALAASGSNYFFINTNTTVANNATLFSPCLNLAAGKVYSTSFKYRTNAGNEKLKVLLVTSTNAAGITNAVVLDDYPTLSSNGSYTTSTPREFIVPTTGIYYIAFQAYSDPNTTATGAIRIDDFVINNTGDIPVAVAPTTLTATPATLAINLSWNASATTGIAAPTSYRLDVSTTSANSGFTTLFTTTNNTTLTYAHTGLTVGTTYFYRVYAINGSGASTSFAAASATPNAIPAPTNLTLATQTTGNQLRLNWTASEGATGYEVERVTIVGGNPQGSYAQVGTSTTNTFTNTGLTTGTVYRYRVRATIGSNVSAYSNEVTSAAVLSVENNEISKQITLSPNPNDGNFNLNVKEARINRVQFVVSDINGKVVYTARGENEDSFDFKLTNLPAGNYTLSIDSDKGKAVKRFIIK